MSSIRPYRPGDEAELSAVCLQTAASGADATGLLDDDEIWANVFVLPYVAHDPDLAFVVETAGGRVAGYVVAAADTEAFERWFAETWWPRFADRWPPPAEQRSEQDRVLRYAYGRGSESISFTADYPAHLHIDLLPELQQQGFGRRLIDALKDALRGAGVAGLQVVPRADNTGAVTFYERLGFEELGRENTVIVFGLRL
jgi:ribosomal protein S18 acetylase RimI-like enzyme